MKSGVADDGVSEHCYKDLGLSNWEYGLLDIVNFYSIACQKRSTAGSSEQIMYSLQLMSAFVSRGATLLCDFHELELTDFKSLPAGEKLPLTAKILGAAQTSNFRFKKRGLQSRTIQALRQVGIHCHHTGTERIASRRFSNYT